jgi:hypothetical protein
MKQRNTVVLSIIIIPGLIFFYCYNYTYVAFKPLLFDKTFEKRETFQADGAFYKSLVLVLKNYDFPYKVDQSGQVLIQRKLSRDADLMYNFTKKSMDSAWIKEHTDPENF